jgi:hypothetical protein
MEISYTLIKIEIGKNVLSIENNKEYKIYEDELKEISYALEKMSLDKEKIDLDKVLILRDRARELAKALNTYVSNTFEK